LIAAAINKYVYVCVTRPFIEGIFLKYSRFEEAKTINDIQHPIMREAIRMLEFKTPQLEITTLADIPAGTGLGSSGSFTTALLKGLFMHRRRLLMPAELAQLACKIEIEILKEPVGKQDQYIAAYGGITCFEFNRDDSVNAYPLPISMDTLYDLEDNLLLFFTGKARSAANILRDQDTRTQDSQEDMLSNLHDIKNLGLRSQEALVSGRPTEFGELLHEHWLQKRRRSSGMSNPQIDEWYEIGMKNGALGGKLVGAGGGGFLMFYVADRNRLRHAMAKAGLEEVRFQFDFEGTKTLLA
jgi:D-glycero-alpha-D-manno-heptose-7-phosphate kinase